MNLLLLARALGFLEREYLDDDASLSDRIANAKIYVDNHFYRCAVVSSIPADAPAGYLMMTANDPNVYVGTGAGKPLRKIPTLAV